MKIEKRQRRWVVSPETHEALYASEPGPWWFSTRFAAVDFADAASLALVRARDAALRPCAVYDADHPAPPRSVTLADQG